MNCWFGRVFWATNPGRVFRDSSNPSRKRSASFKFRGLSLNDHSKKLCGSKFGFGANIISKSRVSYSGKFIHASLLDSNHQKGFSFLSKSCLLAKNIKKIALKLKLENISSFYKGLFSYFQRPIFLNPLHRKNSCRSYLLC